MNKHCARVFNLVNEVWWGPCVNTNIELACMYFPPARLFCCDYSCILPVVFCSLLICSDCTNSCGDSNVTPSVQCIFVPLLRGVVVVGSYCLPEQTVFTSRLVGNEFCMFR